MRKGVNVSNLSRAEWLAERRKGIGGSDAAAVAGLNPWRSAAAVYLDKVGEVEPEELSGERIRVGHDLEDYVARRFAEATGKKVRRNNYMLHHDEYDFILADIDREIVGENAILECKTTNSFASKDWAEEPPLHYQIQCLHYLLVTGADRCYIAALIGNERFMFHMIERDEYVLADLLEIELRFWRENVEAGVCPPPDGSPAYDEMLKKLYPDDDGEAVDLPPNVADMIDDLKAVSELIKKREAEKKIIEQTVKEMLGEAAIGLCNGEKVVTWKASQRTTLDTKALKKDMPEVYERYARVSTSRTFRVCI